MRRDVCLRLMQLEAREVPNATIDLTGGILTIAPDSLGGRLDVFQSGASIMVRSRGEIVGAFNAASVTAITVNGASGSDVVRIDNALAQITTLNGGGDRDKLSAGGGASTLDGGAAENIIAGGTRANIFTVAPNGDVLLKALPSDSVPAGVQALREAEIPPPPGTLGLPQETMTAAEVGAFLNRAAAASGSHDAVIAIVDRNGRILGVRVESGVAAELTSQDALLAFAVDGAVAKARTGGFFGNNEAPLTSRTIQYISQSTITEREVNSNPNITDPNSTVRGPGFVAPIGIRGHFPPNVPFTPQVDLFAIEHTNRDGIYGPGADRIIGTADDELRMRRFNTDPAQTLGTLYSPDSYGFESGLSPRLANGVPVAQSRGIATLPGGIPLVKNGQVVGGIGVFFPGKSGYASEENSVLNITHNPNLPDRTLESEWIAFAAAGGASGFVGENFYDARVGTLNGIDLPAGYALPIGRIDLVGIQLEVFGPGGLYDGPRALRKVGNTVGLGDPLDSINRNGQLNMVVNNNATAATADDTYLRDGLPVSDGWIVTPHDGAGVTAAEVERIVAQGITQANKTRAAIRLPFGTRAKFVFAVADRNGDIVGLYRMADATVFSIDVAVAKARNVNYYADAAKLQAVDQLPGVAAGTAFTNRTFRYLANPRFPTGIEFTPPAPFSQLNDPGINHTTGQNLGAPLPAGEYDSVLAYDAFNPGTNFREQGNFRNQNGIVFFPGSAPIYRGEDLIGGFGVSGDGVDQDDVTTDAGQVGFGVPGIHLRADQVVFQGIRLPYQKFNRNPEG